MVRRGASGGGTVTGAQKAPTGTWWGKLLIVVVALSAAGGAAALAPRAWPQGPGTLVVAVRDGQALRVPVTVGSTAAVTADAETGAGAVRVEAEGGVPVDEAVTVQITPPPGGSLGVDDVRVAVELPDGREALVPAVASEAGVVEATIRPPRGADVVLALLAAVVVLWVTEVVPLFVTSLAIPVVLAATGVGSAREALAPFFDPIIVLFFAGFLMAQAMQRAGLDRVAAVWLVSRIGRGPVRLFAAMLGVTAFLSMWMSNTAAVTVLLPVALAVTAPLQHVGYRKAVVLGIAYAATIGGVGSAIGTPANPLAIAFIAELTGRRITFVEWFAFGLPMVVLFVPVMGVYLWRVSRARVDAGRFGAAVAAADTQRAAAGPFTPTQWQVLAVFAAVVAAWLTQQVHGVETGIVALAGAVALFVLGRCVPGDLGRISWPTLLTFGGGLTLGVFMVSTGVSDWLVTRLEGLAGLPTLVVTAAVAALALALTTVASNTAAAATLIPLAVPLAAVVGVDPGLLVVVVAMASSIDFALVIGTPPTMLAYGTDLFTAREILRKGIVLDVVGLATLLLVIVPLWRLIGLV